MDWLAKCFAGADTKLLEKFESEITKTQSEACDYKNDNKSDGKNARTGEDEKKLIEQFKNLGIPINYK